MGSIAFPEPIQGELSLSGRPVTVFGIFESGKVAVALEDGEIAVMAEPVRLMVDTNALDTIDETVDTSPRAE